MKVFISWSGVRSKFVATKLRDWLPDVIQDVEPWMSASDIDAGARWGQSVQEELSESRFGIICVTNDNQTAPWILFEAGALAKTINDTFVCPYLIGLESSNLEAGPLTQFQAKTATEEGTLDLLRTLNKTLKDAALTEEKLDRAFQRWWPDLKDALSSLPPVQNPATKRPREDMIEEILVDTREIKRILQANSESKPIDIADKAIKLFKKKNKELEDKKSLFYRILDTLDPGEREQCIMDLHNKQKFPDFSSENFDIPDGLLDKISYRVIKGKSKDNDPKE